MENEVPTSDQLVAAMPREELRSVFYLFAGKPDSRIKVFDNAVHISAADVVELNECIERKFETHC